jgi:hypothetical protein
MIESPNFGMPTVQLISRWSGLRALAVLLSLGFVHGCAIPRKDSAAPVADPAAAVAALLSGHYSSQQQSETDDRFFDVRLFMTPIWTERSGEHWLYVEQAMATALDKPYRQRVYRVLAGVDGSAISEVYTLPGDPLVYAGAHRNAHVLDALRPADLSERQGCAIHLRPTAPGLYSGSTHASDCPSDLRGARYATSEVELSQSQLSSWDRGYDAQGTQVWGAVEGPYRFNRLANP